MNTTEARKSPDQTDAPPRAPAAICALELLGEARSVVIEHRGERYELRLTRNGKLILTK
ncbi:MAG: hemin uptake protein HemP [Thiobacillus sp.]|nr:hemin uptake protein HemP [Thiobacillus sp.]